MEQIQQAQLVTGNFYNKYESKNPIAKLLVGGFVRTLNELKGKVTVRTVHEVGCGEGYLSPLFSHPGVEVRASDISENCINLAKKAAATQGRGINFVTKNIYDLTPESDSAELVVCCEVLEHLDDPARALDILASLAKPYLLCSVPREPLWCALNMMRGKYLSDWGNTPGHFQHWSKSAFIRFISTRFEILEVRSPLPWTFLLAKVRSDS
jgi:2-polyprenyl-3-methyl-5-hydroxy-6-metoxy-1,4-benzoquinol methylase